MAFVAILLCLLLLQVLFMICKVSQKHFPPMALPRFLGIGLLSYQSLLKVECLGFVKIF